MLRFPKHLPFCALLDHPSKRTSNSVHDGDPAPVVLWHPEDGCDRQQEGGVGAVLQERVVQCS